MELVQIKIRATVITSRYGALGPGDILRTDAAYAKHLIEECAAAEYVDQPVAAASVGSVGTAAESGAESAAPAPSARRKKAVK